MSLPEELKNLKGLRQWVGFRFVPKGEKSGKIPIDPKNGRPARANDPVTWGTYDEALAAVNRFGLDGVGFEFASGYMGIDLDNVIGEDGTLSSVAEEVVAMVDSYTEYSPSGRGLHILCSASLEDMGARNDAVGLEMYNHGRFFTVTGRPYGDPKPVWERTEQVRAVREKYLGRPERVGRSSFAGSFGGMDSGLWEKMFSSRRGEEILALFKGDLSAHGGDHSRADQALANHLAYWTNGDARRMDRMFRQSGLMRPKWDEARGGQTYGQITLAEALRTSPAFTGRVRPVPPSSLSSWEGMGRYLDGGFDRDLRRLEAWKTGFANLDRVSALYPGLYVLGAASSIGKTTFACQLADQLARAGAHVLYFSLEQGRLELAAKGISRLTAQQGLSEAVTALEVRQGRTGSAVKRAIEAYKGFAGNEVILECGLDATAESIAATVRDYIRDRGSRPVVFVDYLQILRPSDPRQGARDAVDESVRTLKRLQSENGLAVVLISSLNRQNYLMPVDFESFKESGGIEYAADVVWGLQLQAVGESAFERGSLREQRGRLRDAKLEEPRKMELVCLKNRYGISSYSCRFLYYARFDWFVPAEGPGPSSGRHL